MARKQKRSGRCIHCLRSVVQLTDDHVIPRSWYPASEATNDEKWTAPSCRECNERLGLVEAKLLERFGLCIDPSSDAARGIAEKTLRAFNPAAGKNPKDASARAKKREAIGAAILDGRELPQTCVLPGFGGEAWSSYEGPVSAVPIPKKSLDTFVDKLVRGSVYVFHGAYIEQSHAIEHLSTRNTEEVDKLIETHGRKLERTGVQLALVKAEDGSDSYLFGCKIWDTLEVYATVLPIEER